MKVSELLRWVNHFVDNGETEVEFFLTDDLISYKDEKPINLCAFGGKDGKAALIFTEQEIVPRNL